MTFPYRPSVHDDLRTLFGVQRVTSTTRELGASSITKGEGSLDLLAADDATVEARIGDQPDGRFGISITHRGALAFLPDLIGAGEDGLGALEATVSIHGARLDNYRDSINSHTTRLINVEGRNATQDNRLDTHDSQISNRATVGQLGQTNSRVDAVESKNSAQDGRLDSHYSTLASHNTRIGDAQARADSAYTRAGTGIANAATAQARADAAYALAAGAATPGDVNNQVQALRSEVHDWMQTARASNPDLPPPIPN